MAKISGRSNIERPLTGNKAVPVVSGGVTRRTLMLTVVNLTAALIPNSARARINISRKIWRPEQVGIFSSSINQLAALRTFVEDAAAAGATIEWGPIDVSIDVDTVIGAERGLIVPTGSNWVMHPNTRIRALSSSSANYEIIRIHDKSDIIIQGCYANIVGERDSHVGSTGEWGMGVSIRGSTGVKIYDLTAKDCWGDGWYIGDTSNQKYCADLELHNIRGENNRRQGLSLISARNFLCVDGVFTNTDGTNPQAGIDIEPNDTDEYLENVQFIRPVTKNNTGSGFVINLTAMAGGSNPVSINVDDPVDDGSVSNFSFTCSSEDPLDGLIRFNRAYGRNALYNGIGMRRWAAVAPKVIIDKSIIEDWNRVESISPVSSAGIAIYAPSGDLGVYGLGNVSIREPNFRLNSGFAKRSITINDSRAGADGPTAIEIIDPIDTAGLPYWIGSADIKMTDRLEASKSVLPDASVTIGRAAFTSHYQTPDVGGKRTLDITNTQPLGAETEFVIGGTGGSIKIRFPIGIRLIPDALGANRIIQSSAKDSRLKIRKTGANEWSVISRLGTWVTG